MFNTENNSISVEPCAPYIKNFLDNLKLRAGISYYHEFSNSAYDTVDEAFVIV